MQSFVRNTAQFRTSIALASWCAPILFGFFAYSAPRTAAGDETPQLKAQFVTAHPMQDDATIRDVAIVGENDVWAVGDRGVVLKSEDRGATWRFLSISPDLERYVFHSVCFLTNRVGWIAGGTVLPVGGRPVGILLQTLDGGATWTASTATNLPYLKYVRFFDLEKGVLAGDRSIAFPTGALTTTDGGQLWNSMPSPNSGEWNAAAFTSIQAGVLGGNRGSQGIVAQGSILKSGSASSGLQGFQGVSADGSGRAWLAGDGAVLLRSDTSGSSWNAIHPNLPVEISDFTNFHSVHHVGDHVWVAGSPGSAVWKSIDAGRTWTPHATGDSIPLEVIRFANPQRGIAAGALGRICITEDGGETWTNVRGGGRRLAVLSLLSSVDNPSLPFLTKWSREEGYRSASMVVTRRDTGGDAHTTRQLDLRLAHAVQTSGGSRSWIDWRLPVAIPSLAKDREKLLQEWTNLTDRRLSEVLLESLVAELRIWRPSVVLIDEGAPGEYTAELLRMAVTQAMDKAKIPQFSTDQAELAYLQPWTVSKLILQKEAPSDVGFTQDPYEVLPRTRKTLELAAGEALSQLALPNSKPLQRQSFVVIRTDASQQLSNRFAFGDLAIGHGSAARRAQLTISSLDYEKLINEANHRRTITTITDRYTASPQTAGILLGQIKEIISPLSAEQAAQQLGVLGNQYHVNGQWGLAEAVYCELVTRFPEQPVAVEGMLWLMRYWTSAEMNWQRLQTIQASGGVTRSGNTSELPQLQSDFAEAMKKFRSQRTQTAGILVAPHLGAPGKLESQRVTPVSGTLQSTLGNGNDSADMYQMQLSRWQTSAVTVANGLRDVYPQIYQLPELQFQMAALHRRRSEHKRADEIYSEFMKTVSDDPWNIAARGEAYLLRPGAQSPKPILNCKMTRTPPVLDGSLIDPCWANATEIRLGDATQSDTYIGAKTQSNGSSSRVGPQSVVFLTYDETFLYVAASVPVHNDLPQDPPERAGRSHDANLDAYDRISLQIDIDRDYGTYYQFEIDQRGQTREACWDNWNYNPKWYCATSRNLDSWHLECAIPLDQLLPPGRNVGSSWGLGITRILPGIGSQSWTGSGAEVPQPALFGLIRFE
ncbi:YCF48-related protein [Planctomicrobium sp. SH668]|uniref:YCF48-related protein n=1 Tax=Planctomicrobium sp. SH668 TaxID=3448126 RepID=UPI003F5C2D68